jgi:hypothetical protein
MINELAFYSGGKELFVKLISMFIVFQKEG